MSTHFFTNQSGNNLFGKISQIFENNQSFNHFDFLVGYLRASGYFKLRPFLDKVDTVRILVGNNVDQLTKKYQHMGQLYIRSEKETKDTLLDEIYRDIQISKYDEETENSIIQFIDDIIHNKIELRAHHTKTIHAKMYIVYTERARS